MNKCVACGHPIVAWDPDYSVTDDDWVCYNCGLHSGSDAAIRISTLVQRCEKLREERNAVRVKFEQPLLVKLQEAEQRISELEGICKKLKTILTCYVKDQAERQNAILGEFTECTLRDIDLIKTAKALLEQSDD